jgi:MFS family permease
MNKTEQDSSHWPSTTRGWLVAILLALASIASQFDRTVINLTVEPLKEQFALNDTQFGILQGIAFGIFYTLACIPIGRLADKVSRTKLLSFCLFFFSIFAMGSGLVRNYWQLFLMRVGVGIGEASVTPTGFSLLSDSFPPSRLGKPVGFFMMSAPVGIGLALIGGGLLLNWLEESALLESGLLAGLQPWQAAFVIIGFPGLLLVPLFWLVPEPKRQGKGAESELALSEVWYVMKKRKAALLPMFSAFSMVTLVSYTISIWTPAVFQRTYGLNPGEIGLGFGLIMLTFGTAGAYFGGWMTDRLMERGIHDAPLRVAAYGFACCGITGLLFPLMPSETLSLALLAPTIFLANTPYACAGTSIQLIIPNRARGQVSALYITVLTLVGLVIGPMIVGLMTDYIFKNPQDLRYSLAIVIALPAPFMVLLLRQAFAPYRMLRNEFND